MKNIVNKTPDKVYVNQVLISLSEKQGLEELVTGLIEVNPEIQIYSTGGTFNAIEKILHKKNWKKTNTLVQVSSFTGHPEMQGGLVKTLDFKIYLGILSEAYNAAHLQDIKRIGSQYFDLVVVNLYPFTETIAKNSSNLENARSNIDIGGPTMLRSSAKNFLRVASLSDPADYSDFLKSFKTNGGATTLEQRYQLAKKTFKHTAQYDTAIAEYLEHSTSKELACYQITEVWEDRVYGK